MQRTVVTYLFCMMGFIFFHLSCLIIIGTAAGKETKKEESASETESDEDENPILYEQLKLAVEVSLQCFLWGTTFIILIADLNVI